MNVATHTKSHSHQHQNWEKQQDVITHNDVIDAYIQGRTYGRNEYQIAMHNLFELNLKNAKKASEKLYDNLLKLGIAISSVNLKADSSTDFMALVIVSTEDYISERFLEGIKISRNIKSEADNSNFIINFIFTYNAATLNEHCLDSDGYFLKFYGHQ